MGPGFERLLSQLALAPKVNTYIQDDQLTFNVASTGGAGGNPNGNVDNTLLWKRPPESVDRNRFPETKQFAAYARAHAAAYSLVESSSDVTPLVLGEKDASEFTDLLGHFDVPDDRPMLGEKTPGVNTTSSPQSNKRCVEV